MCASPTGRSSSTPHTAAASSAPATLGGPDARAGEAAPGTTALDDPPLFRPLTDATSRVDRKAADLGSASLCSHRPEAETLNTGMEEGRGRENKGKFPRLSEVAPRSVPSEYRRRETGKMFSVFHYFIRGKNSP